MKVATMDDARTVLYDKVFHSRRAGTEPSSFTALASRYGHVRFLVYERDGGWGIVSIGPRGGLYWETAFSGEDWLELRERLP